MVELSQQMGEFLVTKQPDWDSLSQQEIDDLWRNLLAGRPWYIVDDANNTPVNH